MDIPKLKDDLFEDWIKRELDSAYFAGILMGCRKQFNVLIAGSLTMDNSINKENIKDQVESAIKEYLYDVYKEKLKELAIRDILTPADFEKFQTKIFIY
jgi:hypothetical protein